MLTSPLTRGTVSREQCFQPGTIFFSHTNQPAVLSHEPATNKPTVPNRLSSLASSSTSSGQVFFLVYISLCNWKSPYTFSFFLLIYPRRIRVYALEKWEHERTSKTKAQWAIEATFMLKPTTLHCMPCTWISGSFRASGIFYSCGSQRHLFMHALIDYWATQMGSNEEQRMAD